MTRSPLACWIPFCALAALCLGSVARADEAGCCDDDCTCRMSYDDCWTEAYARQAEEPALYPAAITAADVSDPQPDQAATADCECADMWDCTVPLAEVASSAGAADSAPASSGAATAAEAAGEAVLGITAGVAAEVDPYNVYGDELGYWYEHYYGNIGCHVGGRCQPAGVMPPLAIEAAVPLTDDDTAPATAQSIDFDPDQDPLDDSPAADVVRRARQIAEENPEDTEAAAFAQDVAQSEAVADPAVVPNELDDVLNAHRAEAARRDLLRVLRRMHEVNASAQQHAMQINLDNDNIHHRSSLRGWPVVRTESSTVGVQVPPLGAEEAVDTSELSLPAPQPGDEDGAGYRDQPAAAIAAPWMPAQGAATVQLRAAWVLRLVARGLMRVGDSAYSWADWVQSWTGRAASDAYEADRHESRRWEDVAL